MGPISANSCNTKKQLWKLKVQLCGYKYVFVLLIVGVLYTMICLCIAVHNTRNVAKGPTQMQYRSETGIFCSGEYAYIDVTAISDIIYRQPYSRHKDEAYFYEVLDAEGNPFLISIKTITGHPILASSFSCPARITGCTLPLTEDVLANIVENTEAALSLEQARKRYGYTMLNVGQRPGVHDEILWILPVPWFLLVFILWRCKSKGYASSVRALKSNEDVKLLLEDWSRTGDMYRRYGILLGESNVYSLRDGSFFRYQDIQDVYSGYDIKEKDSLEKRMSAALLEIVLNDGRHIHLGRCNTSKASVNQEIRAQLKATIREHSKQQ